MFTAKDVMALREMSGAGMMDCKKALVECDGDMDKAMDYLREKSLAASAKKASRIAAEGVVSSYVSQDSKTGAIAEVNCETDFVAKTDDFKALVDTVAKLVAEKDPADMDELMAMDSGDGTVAEMITRAVAKIGEKITVRRFARSHVEGGMVDCYVHLGGKIGVLVEIACDDVAAAKPVAHDIAMHIAAAKPTCLSKADVNQEDVEHERKILREQAMNEPKPKPANIIEKMVEGRIEKYYKEVCLLEQPSGGQILLDGQDLAHLSGAALRTARRKMGVVFQGYNLLMQKTVAENVAFPLKLAKHDKAQVAARVAELLELVGLADRAASYPSQLSGGQKQRVALARALASRPEVLLCDEPTSALDPLTTKSVLELLKSINKKLGVTIIIITHELSVVRTICNRMVVIDNGGVVEQGFTREIFENPQSSVARLLLGKEV